MMVEPVDDPVVSVKRHLVAEQATEPGPGRKLAGLAAETLELMGNKKVAFDRKKIMALLMMQSTVVQLTND